MNAHAHWQSLAAAGRWLLGAVPQLPLASMDGVDEGSELRCPACGAPVQSHAASMRVTDPAAFFRQVVGGKNPFFVDDIREPLNARLIQPLADYLAESKLSYAEIDPQREEIATALSTKLTPEFSRLGFELVDFRIQGTTFDEDTMRRINRIADVGAEAQAASSAGVTFAELQRLEAMREAARNEGTAGAGMAMAVGMNMAGGATSYVASGEDDLATRLQRLKLLFGQGLITQTEYDAKKNELLSRF